MTKKNWPWLLLLIIVFGAFGSILFSRGLFPYFATYPGFSWLNKLSTNAPIIINRTQEVQLNEGVNIIDLVKQSGNITVSLYAGNGNTIGKFLGNGIIMSSDGLIFTSKAAVNAAAGKMTVVLNDGTGLEATLGPTDPRSDLAILTIAARNLPTAQMGLARELVPAQRIIGIGASQAESARKFLTGFVTNSMRNAHSLERVFTTHAFEETIETDAVISAEFFGGPIVNLNGKVVGMMGNTRSNILPAEDLQTALASYLANGKIIRPFIGLKYLSLSNSLAKLKGLPQAGALVTGFEDSSSAKKGGILAGDLIVAVDGEKIDDSQTFEYLFNHHAAAPIELELIRAGTAIKISVILESND